jgi:hypothetical protein
MPGEADVGRLIATRAKSPVLRNFSMPAEAGGRRSVVAADEPGIAPTACALAVHPDWAFAR